MSEPDAVSEPDAPGPDPAGLDALALALEAFDIPPMAARILVRLATSGDSHQSLDQLAAALGASKASMSTMARILAGRGLVEVVPVRGSRRDHYRLAPRAWARLHHERASAFATVAHLAGDSESGGVRALGDFCHNAALELTALADRAETPARPPGARPPGA